MVLWHFKSKRKPSGGILRAAKRMDKKLYMRGGSFAETTIAPSEGEVLIENVRQKGGAVFQVTKKVVYANISDGAKVVRGKILSVGLNSANRIYTRRNILTRGAILKVEVGGQSKLAKVTSRPGQSGGISAVFFEGELKPQADEKEQKKGKTQSFTKKEEWIKGNKEDSPQIAEKDKKEEKITHFKS
ncbi:MAG: hypothetical protein HYW50_03190 [Candidatus Diapherotrites archaeon]|nr:hypothetical protein [Candidatus Diapherotrites archaeon]